MRFHLTPVSGNGKTGPIPVSTSSAITCPDACPFKRTADGVQGCYADGGPLGMHWRAVTEDKRGVEWPAFLDAVRAIGPGQLWRHNQAGDLPGENDTLDIDALAQLVEANAGRAGYTYTHKPLTGAAEREAIRAANAAGFTINLSANNLQHADALADMAIGPVAVVVPSDVTENHVTPAGRRVMLCPATQRDDVTCDTCKACANPQRRAIIAFPAHGASKRRASVIAIKRVA